MQAPPAHGRRRLIVLDFDGTLYRGSCPALLQGVANADLMLSLCLASLRRPAEFAARLREGLRIHRRRRALLRACRAGQTDDSELHAVLVEDLVASFLGRCTRSEVERAAQRLARFCCPQAWPVLRRLRDLGDPLVVSRSLAVVLGPAMARFAAEVGVLPPSFGVTLDWTAGRPAIVAEHSVLRAADKAATVAGFLRTHPAYGQVLVLGDTDTDAALRDGAAAVLGAESALFVVLHPRDDRARRAADCVFASWSALARQLPPG